MLMTLLPALLATYTESRRKFRTFSSNCTRHDTAILRDDELAVHWQAVCCVCMFVSSNEQGWRRRQRRIFDVFLFRCFVARVCFRVHLFFEDCLFFFEEIKVFGSCCNKYGGLAIMRKNFFWDMAESRIILFACHVWMIECISFYPKIK